MKHDLYLGCDPGAKGCFSSIWRGSGDIAYFWMPMVKAKVGETLDVCATWEYFRQYRESRVLFTLEQSNPRPGEGRTSGAKLAFNKGVIWGQAVAAGFEVQMVSPAVWKKTFGLIGCDKPASRSKACELWPEERVYLAKSRPDVAESLLICEYGRRKAL